MGRTVTTDSTHQYHPKQYVMTEMGTTAYLNVLMKRMMVSYGFGCMMPGKGLTFANERPLVRATPTCLLPA